MPPFCRANGWTVPIADRSPKYRPIDIGSADRAFSGELLTDRRARKREWRLSTNQVTEMVAKAIEGVVTGQGDVWPFNFSASDTDRSDPDLFSAKGTQVAGTNKNNIIIGTSAPAPATSSLDPVYDQITGTAILESMFGSGAFTTDPAVTNLYSGDTTRDNVRTGGDTLDNTTGFSAVGGASIAAETARALRGDRSIRVTIGSAGDGVQVDAVANGGDVEHVASCYVRVDAACTVRIRLIGTVTGTLGTADFALLPDRWTRIAAIGTPTAEDIIIRVVNQTTTDDFNVDSFQLEVNGNAGTVYPTAWFNGAARTVPDFTLPITIAQALGAGDFTFNHWIKIDQAVAATRQLFSIVDDTVEIIDLQVLGNDDFGFGTTNNDGTGGDTLSTTAAITDDDWHMITWVLRRNPEGSEVQKSIYVDGVLTASGAAGVLPDLSLLVSTDTFNFGHQAGSKALERAVIDDAMILPWAAPVAQILAWHTMGLADVAMPQLPRFYLDGDIIPDNVLRVLARGSVPSAQYVVGHVDSVQRSNNREVEIDIREV